MLKFPKPVAVIPTACLGIIHFVFLAQRLYLIFRKTSVRFQIMLVCHRILPEHIQRRVLSVFFYRQDPGRIRQRDIGLIL